MRSGPPETQCPGARRPADGMKGRRSGATHRRRIIGRRGGACTSDPALCPRGRPSVYILLRQPQTSSAPTRLIPVVHAARGRRGQRPAIRRTRYGPNRNSGYCALRNRASIRASSIGGTAVCAGTITRAGPIDTALGRRIRALRLAKGVSQPALARRLGVTVQQIQWHEKGATRMGVGRSRRGAVALPPPLERRASCTLFG